VLGDDYGFPPVDPDDPASVEAYFEAIAPLLSGHAAGGRLELPDANYVKDIIRRVAAGEKLTFYEAKCVAGKNPVDEGLIDKAGTWQGIDFGVRFRAFEPGPPPPPVVPAAELAELARQELTFADPEVDYNPKIAGGVPASLVGIQTWFWVRNTLAALGSEVDGKGQATATATAGQPGNGIHSADCFDKRWTPLRQCDHNGTDPRCERGSFISRCGCLRRGEPCQWVTSPHREGRRPGRRYSSHLFNRFGKYRQHVQHQL
jgi:hypothetical protein